MSDENKRKLYVTIVTPYDVFYEGFADSLVLPAIDGEIGVMPGHSPMIVALNPGEARITLDGEIKYASVSNGFAQVEVDNVIVVVGSAEYPWEIDLDRAEKSVERARKRLADSSTSAINKERSERELMRGQVRLKVAGRDTSS